jgi:hypothetical protein
VACRCEGADRLQRQGNVLRREKVGASGGSFQAVDKHAPRISGSGTKPIPALLITASWKERLGTLVLFRAQART